MILAKVEQAETLRSFGREPAPTVRQSRYTWKDAWKVAQAVLGGLVTMPLYPDKTFYLRTNSAIREWGIDDAYVQKLCEYVRDNMRTPIRFSFMITQADRILAGEWAQNRPLPSAAQARIPSLPED